MRTVVIMAMIAIAAITYITFPTAGVDRRSNGSQNVLLFPSLFKGLNEINKIQVQSNQGQLILTKEKGRWILSTADNYPADISIIKKFLLQLTEIKVIKTKTRNEIQYAALGVNPIEDKGYERYQITIYKKQNEIAQSLMVKKAFHENNRTFMRKIGQKEVFETEGKLELTTDKINWLDANIVSVSSNRIKRVTVNTPDEKFTLSRKADSPIYFKIDELGDHLEEKSQISTSTLAALLESLRFNDVRKKSFINEAPRLSSFRFDLTKEGESIEIVDYQTKLGVFSQFNLLSGSPDTDPSFVSPELIKKFVFKLPKYKRRLLNKRLSDLTKLKANN